MNKKILANIALTVLSVGGIVATAILTAKETPRALELIDESKETKHDELTKFEKVQAAVPAYIPAIAVGAATVAVVVATNVLNIKQIASLTAAYALIDQSFKNYREQANYIYGEDADLKIRQAVSEEKHPDSQSLKSREDEKMLFCIYDGVEDRFFESTYRKVRNAEYEINKEFATEGIATLSHFYEMLGIEDKNDSEKFGWAWDMCTEWYGYAWIDFGNEEIKSDDPDTPNYIMINVYTEPALGYDSDEWEDWMSHKYLIDCTK